MKHRFLRLAFVTVAAAALLLLLAGMAAADITYTDGAQTQLGIDGDGNPTGGSDAPLGDGWRLFWNAPEGQRMHTLLTLRDDIEVIVEVLPADQVGSGDSAGKCLGTAKIEARDDQGRPTQVRIKVRNERTGGDANLAETIWHEFRHTEIWITTGSEDDHDDLDSEESAINEKFRVDVKRAEERLNPPPLPESKTPNYDRIMAEGIGLSDDAQGLAALFEQGRISDLSLEALVDEAADFVDSVSTNEPTFVATEIDITNYKAINLLYTVDNADLIYNESVFECGEAGDTRRVVCADEVLDMPAGEVLAVAMVLGDDVPLTSTDHSYVYSAVFDSDLDPANDWQFRPPFDWDLFRDTDRWYQLIYDHRQGEWSVTVTQLTASGGFPSGTAPSSVRVVIDHDTIVFFISTEEFAAARPGYRLTAFGHDGAFSESDRGADVTGGDPTEPPLIVPDEVLSTVSPVVTPTVDETPEEFLARFVDGLRGDVEFLVSRLNPATLVLYGEDQCRETMSGLLDPETELTIREIGEIGPWEYVIDDITTLIPDALPVEVQRLAAGQTLIQELHWQLIDGRWTWFSDCGTPLN